MNLPLVTVIMPVYNGERYIKEAIDSVLSQSYGNIELVVVDNASTDSTREIVLSYADSRIVLLKNETNMGIVYSRNRGIEFARGDYLATLDSDDIAYPGRLDMQVAFLTGNPEYGMCGTFYNEIDSKGKFRRKIRYPANNQEIQTYLTLGNCFGHSTIMIRSKIAKELKYRKDFEIIEDYDLWYRVSKISKMANLPFYLIEYRVHETSVSLVKMDEMLRDLKQIYTQVLTDLHISFSEKELELHTKWLQKNLDYFKNENQVNELENWILHFYGAVKSKSRFNSKLMYELIAEKWIMVAYNRGGLAKVLNNKLFKLNRIRYLKCLSKRVFFRMGMIK